MLRLAKPQRTCDCVNAIMSVGKERISRPIALVQAGETFFHGQEPLQVPDAADDLSQASNKMLIVHNAA